MKNQRANLAPQLMWTFSAVIVFSAVLAIPALAQQGAPGTPPPPSGRTDPFAEVRERQQREAALRSAEMPSRKAVDDPRHAQVALDHLRQDFKRLQIIRNEMVHAIKANETPDYKRLSVQTEEITKRAGRLKTLLALHDPDGVNKNRTNPIALDQNQLKGALVKLCNGINGFIESPMFKTPDVTNVDERAKTSRVLQNVIDLSNSIRESAARLGKTAHK